MNKYICTVCGYIYDEALGTPEYDIAPGTLWEDLPDDWECPLCGASKDLFEPESKPAPKPAVPQAVTSNVPADSEDLTALEISIICSNLAKGAEKQYMPTEAALFTELADYYKSIAAPVQPASFTVLAELVARDLDTGIAQTRAAAVAAEDRGAQRPLVWTEKATNIEKSILARNPDGDETLAADAEVYVCTICGFIYVGDNLPAVCPVCKVPNWKFEKVVAR